MRFHKQFYKGKYSWWRWLIVLALFITPFLSKEILKRFLYPILITTKDSSFKLGLLFFRGAILLFLFLIIFKILHKRNILTLLTRREKFDSLRFLLGFSIWAVLILVVFSIGVILHPDFYTWNFKPQKFFKLAFVVILIAPFLAIFKTLLYQSYVYQFISYICKGRKWFLIIFIILLACLDFFRDGFMTRHVGNIILINFITLNAMLALITYLDEGVEIVMGMRIANIIISFLYITSSIHPIQHDALFLKTSGPNVFLLVYVNSFILYPLFVIILAKIFKWKNWKEKLFNKNIN